MLRALLAIILLSGFTTATQDALHEAGGIQLLFRSGDYKLLKDGATAKAARAADGSKWVIISTDADMEDIGPRILHEVAHHLTWDKYGEDVAAHGPEFRRICRELITKNQDYYCKGH